MDEIKGFISWILNQEYDFSFNNREIVFIILSVIVTIFVCSNRKIRESLFKIIKILFCKYFVIMFISILAYNILVVFILYKIGFWKFIYTKETLIWVLFSGTLITFNVLDKCREKSLFNDIYKGIFTLTIIYEFIINTITFSLIIEFLLVSIISIVAILLAYTEGKNEYAVVDKYLNKLNSYIGIVLLMAIIISMSGDYKNFFTVSTLKDFFLPIIITIFFIPFLGILAALCAYNQINDLLNKYKKSDLKTKIYFWLILIKKYGLHRHKIFDLIDKQNNEILHLKTINDVKKIFA